MAHASSDHREPAKQADEFKFHLFFKAARQADFLVNVRMQHADERQIAVTLGKIKPVTDHKKIGDLEADVIGVIFSTRRRVCRAARRS